MTKVGFGAEPEPRKIILTPNFFDYEKFMKNDTNLHMLTEGSEKSEMGSKSNNSNQEKLKINKNLCAYRQDLKDLKFPIESYIYSILYTTLQLKKQQREKNYICILCIDFSISRVLKDVYDLIAKTILENSLIFSVRILPKSITPIYTTGYSSGIVVDVGYMFTTITPINNGFPFLDKIETLSIGSLELERFLKNAIIEENITNGKKRIKHPENFSSGLIKYLDDLLIRCAICVNKKISTLLQDPNEESKLKSEHEYSKVDYCKDLQDFQISFLARVKLGEKLFGNPEDEEFNIAYSLLKVLSKINCEDRKKLSQNIVLSGGTTMLMGFYRRLIDEINFWIESEEFKEIKNLQNFIKIHKVIFPRNCLTWIGASLLSSFEKLNLKQLTINREDFEQTEESLKVDGVNSLNNLKKKNLDPLEKIFSYFKY